MECDFCKDAKFVACHVDVSVAIPCARWDRGPDVQHRSNIRETTVWTVIKTNRKYIFSLSKSLKHFSRLLKLISAAAEIVAQSSSTSPLILNAKMYCENFSRSLKLISAVC